MGRTGKIIVTGNKGQLGRELTEMLSPEYDVTGFDIDDLDIRDRDGVIRFAKTENPSVIIHTAAYTGVDACESDVETATSVNEGGTENVALACRIVGARMIYYSTDYVFNGEKSSAYTEIDPVNPKTVYGLTKLAGEDKVKEIVEDHLIFRIGWVYGKHGYNFVKTMAKLGRQQIARKSQGDPFEPLKIVDDQTGNPTWTVDIVRQTLSIMHKNHTGVFHATSEGETTWHGLARAIFEDLGMPVEATPCKTADFPRPAPRPAMSSLENRRLKATGEIVMRHWRTALAEFLQKHGGELSE